MLAYVATKDQFLIDAPDIEDIIRNSVSTRLGISIKPESSEYRSWRESLGRAMFHIMQGNDVPGDAGIAIEYRLHGRQQRIDFIVSGKNKDRVSQVVLIELKQWSEVKESPLREHVRTFLGSQMRDVVHPSYQSWSYARVLEDFYQVVTDDPIHVAPCAYLHNCVVGSALTSPQMTNIVTRAPVFLKSERQQLQDFMSRHIVEGDGAAVIKRIEDSQVTPSKQLVESLSSMLKGNQEFVLVDEQKTAFETIVNQVTSVPNGERLTLIITGGPGTGKSVIAVNALVELLREHLNVRYVTKNAAPRSVYRDKLQGSLSNASIGNLFISSDSFHTSEPDVFDALLVDEAHRLVAKSGFYKNLGENQISEIIRSSRVSVFFSDESQLVTWRDIGTNDELRMRALEGGASVQQLELMAQFRCAGATEYLEWLDSTLGIGDGGPTDLTMTEYDIRIYDDPGLMRDEIFELNESNNKSRLLAGYCWQWVSKKDPMRFDIVLPDSDFAMKWNLESDGSSWIISKDSVHEVGCIHTCQGLEGDYMGVIIGPDLAVDDGLLVGRPEFRAKYDKSLQGFKKAAEEDPAAAQEKADRLIRNTYRTLMTRGMKGTFIYCTDKQVADYFRSALSTAKYVGTNHDETD